MWVFILSGRSRAPLDIHLVLTSGATIRINVIVSGRILLPKVPKRRSWTRALDANMYDVIMQKMPGYVNPAEIHLSRWPRIVLPR